MTVGPNNQNNDLLTRKSHSDTFAKLELRCGILNSINKQVSTLQIPRLCQ